MQVSIVEHETGRVVRLEVEPSHTVRSILQVVSEDLKLLAVNIRSPITIE